MSLKYKITSKENVPVDLAPYYVESEGAFILDVDGAVEKSRLEELRTSNAALARERDELHHRFDGINPDEVRKLADEKRKLEEAQQLKAGEVDKVIETRLKTVRSELEKKIAGLTTERDSLSNRLTTIQIDQGVLTAATKRGLRPTAIPDITARARSIFKLVNGVPLAVESDGHSIRAGKDGVTPITLDEWIESQVTEAPHLFEPNTGSGHVSGSTATANITMKNPFHKDSWNLTEQMRLQRTNPSLAKALRSAAK